MNWVEVCVHTSREAVEAVSYRLQEMGADGVSIEDPEVLEREWKSPFGEIPALSMEDYPSEGVRVKCYIPETSGVTAFVRQAESLMKEIREYGLDPGPARVTTRKLAEESWSEAWKAYYKPVRISKRMIVKPVWESYEPVHDDEVIIELDPGMAFGTGTHPTTTLCLQLLEHYIPHRGSVIDVGCGSGILSVAAAKLGAESVLALDLDDVAVTSAEANVRLNGVQDRVRVRQGDLLRGVTGQSDLVVANILAEIIVRMLPDVPRVLKDSGHLIVSGVIQVKEQLVRSEMEKQGLQIVEAIRDGDWVAIVAKKV
ncbi:50S ribosomal protein L11 methyltransferase [Polycladomyces subterraneus]|uniref:Ribosomal protein L11 methyltransferase n=1 Tax=Polycladomyces subterraneus TaxID=1016997 RepID=A0ABT8IPR8_9BACL|nr:50S ribosomal protein L11 methyltransferase [Polycladomyces subterraneus]MDN4594786.1 50S ribosomal protein L11 methyltransferase [Polycladomyces subterraneus]